MISTLRYVLIIALRDKLFAGLFVFMAFALGASLFLGDSAMVEKYAASAVYAGAVSRMIIVFGLLIFISFHVQRLYDSLEIEAILSRPISRASFVISYWASFSVIAVLLAVPAVIAVSFFLPSFSYSFILWGSSIILESLIVVALGLFCSLTIRRAVNSILAGIGFYMLTRFGSLFTSIADYNISFDNSSYFDVFMKYAIEAIAMLMPRLDLFGQTRWLIYGADIDISLLVVQVLIYVPLLLTAAIFDLKRKQF